MDDEVFGNEYAAAYDLIYGDKDYEAFTSGDYRHVIFNLSLQEGWDDPLVYFGYIDKSMESNIQVEQTIGRLLRQPGGVHYPVERLKEMKEAGLTVSYTGFGDVAAAIKGLDAARQAGVKLLVTCPQLESDPEGTARQHEFAVRAAVGLRPPPR